MAKALFHKGQRVFVKSVGTWATVENVIPHWVSNVEEPIRIYYEVGLGRNFNAHELISAEREGPSRVESDNDNWRILRLRAHWEFDGGQLHSGRGATFPTVVTDELDWGGWRVPKAEYDRDPARIEFQSRMIVNAPSMLRLVRDLVRYAETAGELDADLLALAQRADEIHKDVYHDPSDPAFHDESAVAAE